MQKYLSSGFIIMPRLQRIKAVAFLFSSIVFCNEYTTTTTTKNWNNNNEWKLCNYHLVWKKKSGLNMIKLLQLIEFIYLNRTQFKQLQNDYGEEVIDRS